MTTRSDGLNAIVRRFIEDVGMTTQSFGAGRVIGQIYAYLYFSPAPRNLADMQEALGISKGSASMGVRQLEQWGAVKKVWVKGDRKDYYEANDWFGQILKNAVLDAVAKKLATSAAMLDEAAATLERAGNGDGEARFVKERVEHLRRFRKKAADVWNNPLVRMLLR